MARRGLSFKTYLVYLNNHERDVVLSNTISECSASANLYYVDQGNTTPEAVVILYKNIINKSGTYRNGGIINVIRHVTSDFETSDKTALTTLLSSGTLSPCAGVAFINNELDQIVSCVNPNVQIGFTWQSTSGVYKPGLTDDEMIAITQSSTKDYSFTLDGTTINLDLNYFNFNTNKISRLLGTVMSENILIQGFTKIMHSHNVFENNGRALHYKVQYWEILWKHYADFYDRTYGFWYPSRYSDSYGFMTMSTSMEIIINNNTVNNHFYTYGSLSEAPSYGSYITFKSIFGQATISAVEITAITGVIGDYNVNTMDTLGSLSGFSDVVTSYQFVPAFTTDQTK
jgi:hypothetical protein